MINEYKNSKNCREYKHERKTVGKGSDSEQEISFRPDIGNDPKRKNYDSLGGGSDAFCHENQSEKQENHGEEGKSRKSEFKESAKKCGEWY